MAMALPIAIPSSPSSGNSGNSPTSPDASTGPQTPASPNSVQTLALPPPVDGTSTHNAANTNSPTNAQAKRKPSRRANTAERRATHNAVERQRRETLNGRFLDLAALLPNLSQIRRPSKSSIVNSSIAHIQASRRYRILASREVRLLKGEADALRRELNEWRDRSGLPRVEEPPRGEHFQMVLSGEVEVLNIGLIDEEDGGDYVGDDYGDDEYVGGHSVNAGVMAGNPHVNVGVGDDSTMEDMRNPMAHAAALTLLKGNPDGHHYAHGAQGGHTNLHLQTILPRSSHSGHTPMIVQSPTGVAFENPAMTSMYEAHGPSYPSFSAFPNGHMNGEKGSWGGNMYNGVGAHPGQLYTPPASSHGGNGVMAASQQQAAFLLNLQRQQQALLQRGGGAGHMYGSPSDGDDGSSVGSAPGTSHARVGRRERSGSMGSVGSGYGSPGAGFDVAGGAGVPRRLGGAGGQWDEGMGMGMGSGMGMMKGAPISVGGGGNGHGYAAMML
ncbi:hypothetical protein OBBRIDRAFT_347776 [Obba rivulosa]|uniref:BHLH domain-containing protein n=1 Tax=Obba rivulosa TaxID=1052685 RepID=A0A8E2DFN4_9APHY|nr:hypothetical protein OBBRIDRAFT_347776 [Obba rivulosa]